MSSIYLNELVWFQEGPGVRNYQYTDSGVKLINVTNLSGRYLDLSLTNRYISNDEAYGKYKHFLCDDGDLVIASSGITYESIPKKVSFVRECDLPLCMNTSVIRFKIKQTNKLLIDYLYYFFKSNAYRNQISKLMTGSAQMNYGPAHLKKVTIKETSLEIQKKAARELTAVSKLIEKNQMQLFTINELVRSRFIEMFGDPLTNSKGWVLKRFDEICENLDSRRIPITASDRKAGIYPYYGASGIVDYVDDYIFDEDILLISEDGANLLARQTPIAFSVSGKTWVNNHAHVVRFNDMGLQKYIEVFFSMIDISDQITGSAQPKLNQAKLNAMLFPIPDKDLTDSFLNFLNSIEKAKKKIQNRDGLLNELLSKKMDEYFKGDE